MASEIILNSYGVDVISATIAMKVNYCSFEVIIFEIESVLTYASSSSCSSSARAVKASGFIRED